MNCLLKLTVISCAVLFPFSLHAQSRDSVTQKLAIALDGSSTALLNRASNVNSNMQRQLLRSLDKLQHRESRLKAALSKRDSVTATQIGTPKATYDSLRHILLDRQQKLNAFNNVYDGKLDSLKTVFKFVGKYSPQAYAAQLKQYNDLQNQFNQSAQIQAYLKQRQDQLLNQVSQVSQLRAFRKYQQQIAYYKNAVSNYKELWNHPDQLEQKVLGTVAKLPAFRIFFASNSDLAAVFRQPGSVGSVDPSASSNGLQTRAALDKFFESAGGGNMQAQVQRGVQDAGSGQAKSITDKLSAASDARTPHLKQQEIEVNPYHGRPFLQRLEKGFNVQSEKSNSILPAASVIAANVAYKFNPKISAGFGAGGKVGWGQNINKIHVTAQGIAFRTFVDGKIIGNFYLSGAWEFNYQKIFTTTNNFSKISDWKQSALVGITKKFPIDNKMFKNYNVQLLYDFFYRSSYPITSPFKFRIGYSL